MAIEMEIDVFFDRIIVLDKGRIAEFDEPSKLLINPESIFYGLAKEHGLVAE